MTNRQTKKSRRGSRRTRSRRHRGGGCGCSGNKSLFFGGAPLSDITTYGPNIPSASAFASSSAAGDVTPSDDRTTLVYSDFRGGRSRRRRRARRGRGSRHSRRGGSRRRRRTQRGGNDAPFSAAGSADAPTSSSYTDIAPSSSAGGEPLPADDRTSLVYSNFKGGRRGRRARARRQRGGGWLSENLSGALGGSFSVNPITNFGTSAGYDIWGNGYGSRFVNPSPAVQPVGFYGPSNPRVA